MIYNWIDFNQLSLVSPFGDDDFFCPSNFNPNYIDQNHKEICSAYSSEILNKMGEISLSEESPFYWKEILRYHFEVQFKKHGDKYKKDFFLENIFKDFEKKISTEKLIELFMKESVDLLKQSENLFKEKSFNKKRSFLVDQKEFNGAYIQSKKEIEIFIGKKQF